MIPLVAIGLITIVIASLVLMNGSITDQQELAEINNMVQQKNTEIAAETNNIKAVKTDLGGIEFTNTQNQQIKIIQIRVYDDDGEFVKSFDVDEIISGNTDLEILVENLPAELQGMLVE